MRSLAWLLLFGACASAAQLHERADRDNPRAEARALATFLGERRLEAIEPPVLEVPELYGNHGGSPVGTKGLLSLPASGSTASTLAYPERRCARESACGCQVPMVTHYGRDGDHIVIVRMVPDIHEHTVTRSGQCGDGCGHPEPPELPTIRSLGAIEPSRVEIVDLHYDFDRVIETCDQPLPAP